MGIGTIVRIPLHGRRVRGWVVDDDVAPDEGRRLLPLAGVVGMGPAPELLALADWAAWRWAGRAPSLLRGASPPFVVAALPEPGAPPAPRPTPSGTAAGPDEAEETVSLLATDALSQPRSVLRLAPATDTLAVAVAAARRGPALLITASVAAATMLADRLAGLGVPMARMPQGWATAAAGGCSVVGARAAAWAPVPALSSVVVFDAHDEAMAEERAPTWNAWQVAAERARQSNVPCLLVSPHPTLEQLAWGPLLVLARSDERRGWPPVQVVDRRRDDPRLGLYSTRLVDLVRSGRRVACILNRRGRARLLACAACAEVTRCTACGGACETAPTDDTTPAAGGGRRLVCGRCGLRRPLLCQSCGAQRLKVLRVGVSRAREELAALARVPVGEVTGDSVGLPDEAVVVGTEALLHRLPSSWAGGSVAFLDFDQELLAPRYRAAEQALALLGRAARVVGERDGGGSILIQTRLPSHEVVTSAVHADPGRLAQAEIPRRHQARLPPSVAVAVVSGAAAVDFVDDLPATVEALGPADGRYLLRAEDHQHLCDALARTPRPAGRLRIEVDPQRA